MATVKRQVEQCIALFKGADIHIIESSLKILNPVIVKELCSKFNCSESELANKLS